MAVDAIRQMEGEVVYEWQVDDLGNPIENAKTPVLHGWQAFLGIDFFFDVYSVRFPKEVTDHGVRFICDLSGVEEVDLAYCYNISDQAVEHLTMLPNLRILYLYRNDPIVKNNFIPIEFDLSKQKRITDASLSHISKIRTLEELELWENDFSDMGIERLHDLHSLQYVGVSSPRITESGVSKLEIALPKAKVSAYIMSKPSND